jgi:hypothetical protein
VELAAPPAVSISREEPFDPLPLCIRFCSADARRNRYAAHLSICVCFCAYPA